jgi:hypothetical protein
MYVTLLMRARKQTSKDPLMEDPQAALVLARLYRTYPYLLHTDVLVPGL